MLHVYMVNKIPKVQLWAVHSGEGRNQCSCNINPTGGRVLSCMNAHSHLAWLFLPFMNWFRISSMKHALTLSQYQWNMAASLEKKILTVTNELCMDLVVSGQKDNKAFFSDFQKTCSNKNLLSETTNFPNARSGLVPALQNSHLKMTREWHVMKITQEASK